MAVPIIDISGLRSPDIEARRAVAKELGAACADIGFFVVVNHGIPSEKVDACWTAMEQFFDLPIPKKMPLKSEDPEKYPYGFSPFGGEVLSIGKSMDTANADVVKDLDENAAFSEESAVKGSTKEADKGGDLKEMFCMGPMNAMSGMPPTRFPAEPAGFENAWVDYYEECINLGRRLLAAFALELNLPENWFEDKLDRHASALRANYYLDQKNMVVTGERIRCSAHTDYGTITILKSGGPGLQVCKDKEDPVWLDVPFVEGAFIINLGDLMRRWTNEQWCSTLHRVVNPPAGENWGKRHSLAYFLNLNSDAVVEAIPACVPAGEAPLHEPIIAGDFLMMKHVASNTKADRSKF